jgi:hypothetical protein
MTLEEIVNSLKSAGQDYGQLFNNNPKYTAVASNVTKGLENLVPPQFTNTQDAKSQEYSKKLAEWALGNGMGMSGMALSTKIPNTIKYNLNADLLKKYLSTGKLSPKEMAQYEANGLAMETPQLQRYNLSNANAQGGSTESRAADVGFGTNKWHETDINGFNGITADGFNPNRAVAAASDEQTPYAVFVKDNAKPVGIKNDNQIQMPLMTREGNSLSFNTRDGLKGYFNQYPSIKTAMDDVKNADKLGAAEIDRIGEEMFSGEMGVKHPNKEELWRQISEIAGNNGMVTKLAKVSKDNITSQLKNDGIDSINLFKDQGSMGRSVNTQMILDPKNIRSRFAAFDPLRKNSSSLLASGLLGALLFNNENKTSENK